MTDSQYLQSISCSMTDILRARPPIRFVDPVDTEPSKRSTCLVSGVASLLSELSETAIKTQGPSPTPAQELSQKRWKTWQKRQELLQNWNPHNDQHIKGNPHATLVVYKLPRSTTEEGLARHFGSFGPIVYVRVVRDHRNNPRGYAFVQFSQPSIAKEFAQRRALTIEGRPVMCDTQRAKIQATWRPKRLGGVAFAMKSAIRHPRGNNSSRIRGGRTNIGRGRRVDRPPRANEITPYSNQRATPVMDRPDPRAGGRSLRKY